MLVERLSLKSITESTLGDLKPGSLDFSHWSAQGRDTSLPPMQNDLTAILCATVHMVISYVMEG